MRLWRWVRRLFVLDVPPVPALGADGDDVIAMAVESRRAAERLASAAREQAQRMAALEGRLKLYERRPGPPLGRDGRSGGA